MRASAGLRLFAHRRAGKSARQGRVSSRSISSRGDPVAIDGKKLSPAALLTQLNALGRKHGVGRLDLVENRFVGMKSRGMYETPGGTILHAAHRGIESITLDRGAAHLKDELMPRYAELIYNGFWFSPEREMLQVLIDKSQEFVTGRVRLKLYKGSAFVVGRESAYSLYDQDLVTFEEEDSVYNQFDAEGFIKLNALRLRTLGQRKRKAEASLPTSLANRRLPACRGNSQVQTPVRADQWAFRRPDGTRPLGSRFGPLLGFSTGSGRSVAHRMPTSAHPCRRPVNAAAAISITLQRARSSAGGT